MNILVLRRIKIRLKSDFINLYSKLNHKEISQSRKFVIITIDTEQDVNTKYVNQGTYANIKYGLPKVIDIFKKYNCKGTFFVTPDAMLQNATFFNVLKETHEIGYHIHPEFFTCNDIKGIRHEEYLCNFPRDEQEGMIETGSRIIEKTIGIKPTSFRAGRFGIGSETIDILMKEGYLVDSSCTPYINWGGDGGPNWSNCSKNESFFLNNINAGSTRKMLEVPVSILNLAGIKYWLRPSVSNFTMMQKMVDLFNKRGIIILNLMFHSMESIDPNPYLKSSVFIDRLDDIISYLSAKNYKFITCNELYEMYTETSEFQTHKYLQIRGK